MMLCKVGGDSVGHRHRLSGTVTPLKPALRHFFSSHAPRALRRSNLIRFIAVPFGGNRAVRCFMFTSLCVVFLNFFLFVGAARSLD